MSTTDNINIKIIHNNKPFKDLHESVNCKTCDFKGYLSALRTIQKAVNSALTEIVEQEKSNETMADECMEDDEDEESDIQKPHSTAKRKAVAKKSNKRIKL